ncbi:MAG: hypothetical protein KDD34_08990 [Bdellovibrionales bacterium]|nr:hypothetical protein [Bdellovibrionales bacterium]
MMKSPLYNAATAMQQMGNQLTLRIYLEKVGSGHTTSLSVELLAYQRVNKLNLENNKAD